MPNATELDKYYKALTDQELLNLKREGGFTAEAEQVLGEEMARRNLGVADGDLTFDEFAALSGRKSTKGGGIIASQESRELRLIRPAGSGQRVREGRSGIGFAGFLCACGQCAEK